MHINGSEREDEGVVMSPRMSDITRLSPGDDILVEYDVLDKKINYVKITNSVETIKNIPITVFAIENIINRLMKLLFMPFYLENSNGVDKNVYAIDGIKFKTKAERNEYIVSQLKTEYPIDSVAHYIQSEPLFRDRWLTTPVNLVRDDAGEYNGITLKLTTRIITDDYDRCQLFSDLIKFAIAHISSFCVVCGQSHNVMANVSFYAPCEKELCNHIYRELDFGDILDSIIQDDIKIADIKISIYYNYVLSKLTVERLNKLDTDLTDFQKKFVLAGEKSYTTNDEIVRDLNVIDLTKKITDRKLRNLILYILTLYQMRYANHTHPKGIDGTGRLIKYDDIVFEFMNINVKYLVDFNQTLKTECLTNNVVVAYHGTKPDVLHNILKVGLLNMSRTAHQTSGAVYGEGVYLGNFSTAKQYAFRFGSDRAFAITNLASMRPMLEVNLSCPQKFYNIGLGGIFVVPSEYGQQSKHILITHLLLINS
jgi:hypothetical protein